MIHKSEIMTILHKHVDIAYEQDGEVKSLVIRAREFCAIAKEIMEQIKESQTPNLKHVGIGKPLRIGELKPSKD
jgi:hypothetical protein